MISFSAEKVKLDHTGKGNQYELYLPTKVQQEKNEKLKRTNSDPTLLSLKEQNNDNWSSLENSKDHQKERDTEKSQKEPNIAQMSLSHGPESISGTKPNQFKSVEEKDQVHLETQTVFHSPQDSSQNSYSDDSLEKDIEEDKNEDGQNTVPRKPSKNDEGDSQ